MAILRNPKHEAFVLAWIAGQGVSAAYAAAGFSPSRTNADRLSRRPGIVERYRELMVDATRRGTTTASRVIDELGKIAFSNPLDYMRQDAEGQWIVDLSGLTREQAAALAEVSTTAKSDGSVTATVRPLPKLQALEMLAKHFGLFKREDTSASISIETLNVTISRDLAVLVAQIDGAVDQGAARELLDLKPVAIEDAGAGAGIGGPGGLGDPIDLDDLGIDPEDPGADLGDDFTADHGNGPAPEPGLDPLDRPDPLARPGVDRRLDPGTG